FIAVAKRQHQLDRVAASFFRKKRSLDAFEEIDTFNAGFDILRRRIERFAGGDRLFSLVIVDQRFHLGISGYGNALGLFSWDEDADRAIVRREIFGSNFFDLRRGDFFDSIAVQIVQSPIADGDPFRQAASEFGGVGGSAFASFQDLLLGALNFLVGD